MAEVPTKHYCVELAFSPSPQYRYRIETEANANGNFVIALPGLTIQKTGATLRNMRRVQQKMPGFPGFHSVSAESSHNPFSYSGCTAELKELMETLTLDYGASDVVLMGFSFAGSIISHFLPEGPVSGPRIHPVLITPCTNHRSITREALLNLARSLGETQRKLLIDRFGLTGQEFDPERVANAIYQTLSAPIEPFTHPVPIHVLRSPRDTLIQYEEVPTILQSVTPGSTIRYYDIDPRGANGHDFDPHHCEEVLIASVMPVISGILSK